MNETSQGGRWQRSPEVAAAIARALELGAVLGERDVVADAELALRGLHPVSIAHGSPDSPEEQQLLWTTVRGWARDTGHLTSTAGGSEHTTFLFTDADAAVAFQARVAGAAPRWWRITATAKPRFQ